MNSLLFLSLRWVGYSLAVSILSACTTAPTYETLQTEMTQKRIPYWKKNAEVIQAKHQQVSRPDVLAQMNRLDLALSSSAAPAELQKQLMAKTPQEMEMNMEWLRWRILSQNADGRLAYYYAQYLSHARNERGSLMADAAVFMMVGRLALEIDGARCMDRSSPSHVKNQFESNPAIQQINAYLAKLSKPQRSDLFLHAIAIEEIRGERTSQSWLCSVGLQSLIQAMNTPANIKTVLSTGNALATTTLQVDTSKITPQYKDEAAWKIERRQILDRELRSVLSK